MSYNAQSITRFCKLSVNCILTQTLCPVNQLLSQTPFRLSTICTLRISTFSTKSGNSIIFKNTKYSRKTGALLNNAPMHMCLRSLSTETSNSDGDYQVVYKGSISKRVARVKMVSIAGSTLGLAALPKLLTPVLQSSLISGVLLVCCSSFFIVATPLILHWMCRRYITELKFDSKRKLFMATVMSLFLRKKHLIFSAQEVVVPGTPLLLTSFLVHGYPFLVDAEDFIDVDAYKHLMGYDKPIDLQMKKE